jgi:hypothetical protein
MHISAALLTFTLAATDARQSVRCNEANPIVRPLVNHPAALYMVKLSSAALTTWIVEHERKQGRTKTAWLLWIGVNAAQGAVVWHNARVK